MAMVSMPKSCKAHDIYQKAENADNKEFVESL